MIEVEIKETLWALQCASCCMTFGVPKRLIDDRRQDGHNFYCPNGHINNYGRGENAKLREELSAARTREQLERDQRLASEREKESLAKRIANGCCPCCRRSFKNLQRHMAHKHPDFKKK